MKYKSKQEEFLAVLYPDFKYEPHRYPYVIETTYTPDFLIGKHKSTGLPVYLELKEFLPYEDLPKYRTIIEQYRGVFHLWFVVRNIQKKTLNSLSTFAERISWSGSCILPKYWLEDIEL